VNPAEEFLAREGKGHGGRCLVCDCPRAVELINQLLDAWGGRRRDPTMREILGWLLSQEGVSRITFDSLRGHLGRSRCAGDRWRSRNG